jgi:hypothetical protein
MHSPTNRTKKKLQDIKCVANMLEVNYYYQICRLVNYLQKSFFRNLITYEIIQCEQK